jgi:hypothetical protein
MLDIHLSMTPLAVLVLGGLVLGPIAAAVFLFLSLSRRS